MEGLIFGILWYFSKIAVLVHMHILSRFCLKTNNSLSVLLVCS